MKTFQIRWQNRTTGETELIEEGSVESMDEMSAWVASVKRYLETRYGWQLLICGSDSEHFVKKEG